MIHFIKLLAAYISDALAGGTAAYLLAKGGKDLTGNKKLGYLAGAGLIGMAVGNYAAEYVSDTIDDMVEAAELAKTIKEKKGKDNGGGTQQK